MNREAKIQRYNLVAQALHWFVVALFIGIFVTNSIRESVPEDAEAYWRNLHMSMGILIFLTTFVRIAWRKVAPPPPMIDAPKLTLLAANLVHVLLNLATLLIPVFGYLRVASKNFPADFFGTKIPSILGEMPGLHEAMENIFHGEPMEIAILSLIGIHVLAALWHQYVRKDNALRRMLPW